jgi:adenosine deaminase
MPRPIAALPKAHLHLHLTGSMRHATLVELAGQHRVHLPESLAADWPPQLSAADERGWFRFQRLYDIARSVVRTPADVRRLISEAAQDEQTEGSGWLELQVDPSGYAQRFGGLTPMLELVLDAAATAAQATGVGIGIIVAANRIKHPLEARTLARLAAAYAARGVIGFGHSNDERRGATAEFVPAFRIAARAGLRSVPHGGELAGPASVQACLDLLNADRIGHGVSAVADPVLLRRLAASQTTPTIRCCSVPGWPRSTSWPARCTECQTANWLTSPGCQCSGRQLPRWSRSSCWPASTPGWPSRRHNWPPEYRAAEPPSRRTVGPPDCRAAELSGRWTVGSPSRR